MADVNNSVTLTFGYADTDFTRKYTFGGISATALDAIKTNVLAVNASLSAGTAGGLSSFFLSDAGEHFNGIVAAQYETTEETIIPLNE